MNQPHTINERYIQIILQQAGLEFEIRTADRDGNGFLCYLNAESGEEEKILLISEEDGCFLTY